MRDFQSVRMSALALVVLASGRAQPRADRLPSLDQIVDQYVSAIGGRAALSQLGPVQLTGRCESTAPDESGPIEILVKAPKVAYNLNRGSLRMGFNGESVWRITPTEGLQQRQGRQMAELVSVFDPARVLSWKQWYPEMAFEGVQKLGDRETYVLETHPGGAATERIFIDRQSGLLVRDEVAPRVAFTFGDYREVNGVRAAFAVRQTTPNGITYTYRFDAVQPIAVADESRFEPR